MVRLILTAVPAFPSALAYFAPRTHRQRVAACCFAAATAEPRFPAAALRRSTGSSELRTLESTAHRFRGEPPLPPPPLKHDLEGEQAQTYSEASAQAGNGAA